MMSVTLTWGCKDSREGFQGPVRSCSSCPYSESHTGKESQEGIPSSLEFAAQIVVVEKFSIMWEHFKNTHPQALSQTWI